MSEITHTPERLPFAIPQPKQRREKDDITVAIREKLNEHGINYKHFAGLLGINYNTFKCKMSELLIYGFTEPQKKRAYKNLKEMGEDLIKFADELKTALTPAE